MLNISMLAYLELIIGVALWWVAVYLISQNPHHRIVKLIFGLFLSISVYLSSDIFFNSAINTEHYYLIGPLLKLIAWSIYLPSALFYHLSFGNNLNSKKKIIIFISYASAFISIYFDTFTNLTRDYNLIASDNFKGDLASPTASLFWFGSTYLLVITILSAYNLWKQINKFKKNTFEQKRLYVAFWGVLASILLTPFVILGYYSMIPNASILSSVVTLLTAIPLFYSVVKYNLFIDDTKVVFGKNFLYSTISIFTILIIFLFSLLISGTRLDTTQSLVLPFLIIYLVIASHPAYNWAATFINDLIYNPTKGFSVVTDDEINNVLKNYHQSEKLESSPLLRLKILNAKIHHTGETSVDCLKDILKESIEYFKPESDPHRRIKSNLKYHLLKMLVFDEAEEGQILWELGFEEYPVKILSQERRYRPPLFEIKSPADYTYTSRNAFIALKKEAIHDVTWRISYLEKHFKK